MIGVSIDGQAQRLNSIRSKQVGRTRCIRTGERPGSAAAGEQVRGDLFPWSYVQRVEQNTAKQRVLVTLLVVDFANIHALVLVSRRADRDQTALIRRSALAVTHLVRDVDSHSAVLRRIDAVVDERRSQLHLPASVTGG